MTMYQLKLFVTGESSRSQRAINALHQICQQELGDQYKLVVIDVLQSPQLAEDAHILATPTVIREAPSPHRRVIGDFSDPTKVLLGLELNRGQAVNSTDRSQGIERA